MVKHLEEMGGMAVATCTRENILYYVDCLRDQAIFVRILSLFGYLVYLRWCRHLRLLRIPCLMGSLMKRRSKNKRGLE